MIIRRSTYEAEMLRAFQSGRDSAMLYNDDVQAMNAFADSKKFTLKSIPKPIIIGKSGRGWMSYSLPFITDNATQNNNSIHSPLDAKEQISKEKEMEEEEKRNWKPSRNKLFVQSELFQNNDNKD